MKTKENNSIIGLQRWKHGIRNKVLTFNTYFNRLPTQRKRIIVLGAGMTMAVACFLILFQSLFIQSDSPIETESITVPNDIFMNAPNQQLTPLGKMKGEIEGEFESFHVAIDTEGQLFINRDPELSKDSLNKEKGWKPISRKQLKQYEKQLHVIPSPKKGRKQ